jgi:molecular chaperone HscA
LLADGDHRSIAALMERVRAPSAGDDHDAINAAVEALAQGTEEFAAARMNRGIRQALAGRSIEDV